MKGKGERVSVIGIGNLLMGDDGFGVHVLRFLESRYYFPANVRLVDCGTAGIYMAPVFEETDMVVMIDSASIDGHAPGSIVRLDHKAVRAR